MALKADAVATEMNCWPCSIGMPDDWYTDTLGPLDQSEDGIHHFWKGPWKEPNERLAVQPQRLGPDGTWHDLEKLHWGLYPILDPDCVLVWVHAGGWKSDGSALPRGQPLRTRTVLPLPAHILAWIEDVSIRTFLEIVDSPRDRGEFYFVFVWLGLG